MSAIFIFFIVLVPYIIYTIHHYHSTVFYITSRRIIFFTTKGLFGNHRREIRLENITSIRAMRPGLFAKICKFGDLFFTEFNCVVNRLNTYSEKLFSNGENYYSMKKEDE